MADSDASETGSIGRRWTRSCSIAAAALVADDEAASSVTVLSEIGAMICVCAARLALLNVHGVQPKVFRRRLGGGLAVAVRLRLCTALAIELLQVILASSVKDEHDRLESNSVRIIEEMSYACLAYTA